MVVLVALDPARRLRTLTVVTVAGGLASTAFAPLTARLVEALGWRTAILVLGFTGGLVTALLHATVLPAPVPHDTPPQSQRAPVVPIRGRLAHLRIALLFEQAAMFATTVHLVGLLTSRGASIHLAAVVLGTIGVGKVAGRLLLIGPTGRAPLAILAAGCSLVQLLGLSLPFTTTAAVMLLPIALVVGAASGATTVLRPLLIVDLVGAPQFALVSARLQRATVLARAGSPFVLGAAVAVFGWSTAWAVSLLGFGIAAERYLALHGRYLQPQQGVGRGGTPVPPGFCRFAEQAPAELNAWATLSRFHPRRCAGEDRLST